MLYLDILTLDGGQMYLDIHSVERITRTGAAGLALQGILGDGYQEAQALVEFVAGEVTLTCINCSAADFALAASERTDDFSGLLQNALKDELRQSGTWLGGMNGRLGEVAGNDGAGIRG